MISEKKIFKWFIIIFLIVFSFALFKEIGQRVAWGLADHVTHGAIKAQNMVLDRKLRSFGNLMKAQEEYLRDEKDMDFQEFKRRYTRITELEYQIAKAVNKVVSSYTHYGNNEN